MKYYVTLKNKTYEVEVLDGEAELISETDAAGASPEPARPSAAEHAPSPRPERVPKAAQVPAQTPVVPVPAAPAAAPAGDGAVLSPMPGGILELRVTEGQQVNAGDVVLILEAMKMENEIVATASGTVQKILVTKGQSVQTGEPLVVIG